jgi:hypothetical protein
VDLSLLTTRRALALLAVSATIAVPAAYAALDGTATVRFGNPSAGSSFPPPSGHDRSFNAMDNMIPRTVVIERNGSVTFAVDGLHQPAVYAAGTTPDDITIPPSGDFVNDSDGRIWLGSLNVPPATSEQTTPAGTFATPGTYLVICNFLPHFAFAKMYGWVEVK